MVHVVMNIPRDMRSSRSSLYLFSSAAGQTLRVKGYIRSVLTDSTIIPSPLPQLMLTTWGWDDLESNNDTLLDGVDTKYGSFELDIAVPKTATASSFAAITLHRRVTCSEDAMHWCFSLSSA